MTRYRPNVAAILQRKNGLIWIGERVDRSGAWQFPQGGVDKGETHIKALYRELNEEVGLAKKDIKILASREGYKYKFASGRLRWGIYGGQEQVYYHLRVPAKAVNIHTKKPEFRDGRWIKPEEFELAWLPRFKVKTYRQVMKDFFGIKLKLP